MRIQITLAAAALALTACNPAGDDPTDKTPPGEPAAASTTAMADLKPPKAGKWRMSSEMTGGPAKGMKMPAVEVCLTGDDYTAGQRDQLPEGATCQEPTVRKEGGAVVTHVQCTHEGRTFVMDSRLTGDMDTRYVNEMTSRTTPEPAPGMGVMNMTVTAERIGDC